MCYIINFGDLTHPQHQETTTTVIDCKLTVFSFFWGGGGYAEGLSMYNSVGT